MKIDLQANAPSDLASLVPEGATYFEGVVSNGELNRNGYIIRPQALIDSLAVFMLNPIILLQHNTDEPVGRALGATVRGSGPTQEVFVQGYVFDDLTEGRFSRGLFKALSTGHLTLDVEFENTETGEILSKEEFEKFNWEERTNGKWQMAVTKLEWVEFSLVAIGSNRKSLVTRTNAIKAMFSGKNFCEETLKEINEASENENTEQPEAKAAPIEIPAAQPEVTEQPSEEKPVENADETPATTEEPVEKDDESASTESETEVEGNRIKISVEARKQLEADSNTLLKILESTFVEEEKEEKEVEAPKVEDSGKPAEEAVADPKPNDEATETNALAIKAEADVKMLVQNLLNVATDLEAENNALRAVIEQLNAKIASIPAKKGTMFIESQFNSVKESPKSVAGASLRQLIADSKKGV